MARGARYSAGPARHYRREQRNRRHDTMKSTSRMDRRTFFTVSGIGVAAAAVGARAVMAQDSPSTPEGTPGATPGASPSASGVIEVHAVDIAFEPVELTIPADTDVDIKITNMGLLQHDFFIEDTDYESDMLDPEDTQTMTVKLAAGEYTYYCSVPGHREAGMEGTLTVE
jgi:plastocyanin